ncbi:hypothetical protein T08_16064 [Trichinella sp. T8]|nr:hypothetical protein T08_16064 [Trichinella sp. T8]
MKEEEALVTASVGSQTRKAGRGLTSDGLLALCTFLHSSGGIHPTSEKNLSAAKNAAELMLKNYF